MSEKPILINKKINDLEIKMLRKNQDCYIKIEPITQKSNPKILIIIINGEKHQFDIYDKNGREVVEVGSHQRGIVEELEKAHIYIEQIHKQITEQTRIIQLLKERLVKIESRK